MNLYSIRKVQYEELDSCTQLIRECFDTVAQEFQLTIQNCPTNGAFIKLEHIKADWNKGNMMFGLYIGEKMIGFVQLKQKSPVAYELEKLAVLPEYRHMGHGLALIQFALQTVAESGARKITIGIIEENTRLKKWYQSQGFIHTGTKKITHLPFTVGFMEINIL